MYQEIIKAKDSVIESLTKRLDELECYQPDSKHSSSESMIQLQNLQVRVLQDKLDTVQDLFSKKQTKVTLFEVR